MPSLGSTMTWTLELDNDELLLVLKALGGRLKKEDHAHEAFELGNRITSLRVARLKQIAVNAYQLEQALSEAEEGKTDDQAV